MSTETPAQQPLARQRVLPILEGEEARRLQRLANNDMAKEDLIDLPETFLVL